MKPVIVPVDFSETSLNAARFAAQMFSGHDDVCIILYSMFEDEKEADTTSNYLESLKKELELKGNNTIDCVQEFGRDFIDNLSRLAQQKTAHLIVMGITGRSTFAQVFIGSNTLKMVDKNICPVMIIPPEASFREIKNVAFTSDFQAVEETTPVLFIKSILNLFNPSLHIINVDSSHYVSLTDEFREAREKMFTMFEEFKPEFYFIGMNDIHEAINQFVYDKNIDLIVTVPRYHTFLNTIFKGTHTKKLVYHSSVPILAAHE
ncbi:MAG: universal stress protein [Bacteroidota bacterium]|nr:universal stress protein [Bacteroidota bacterium]